MAIIGPGAVKVVDNQPAMLDGASEYEYITLLNPLTDDFAIRVAQDVPVNMPFAIGKDTSGQVSQMTNNEQDARTVYGLNLKNKDFQGRRHIVNDTVILAGKTINLKGSEAQVAVRQLVNEILQREGQSRLMADPNLRHQVEERIIIKRGFVQDLLDNQFTTPQQQATQAINKSNEVLHAEEQPFSGLVDGTAAKDADGSNQGRAEPVQQERRSPGRPKAS